MHLPPISCKNETLAFHFFFNFQKVHTEPGLPENRTNATVQTNVFIPNTAGTQSACLCVCCWVVLPGDDSCRSQIWIINQQRNIPRAKGKKKKKCSRDLHKAGGLMSNCEGLISQRDKHVTHYPCNVKKSTQARSGWIIKVVRCNSVLHGISACKANQDAFFSP